MAKGSKPEAFGDGDRRCLVSSIAGYEELTRGNVSIYLKSGETVELKFNNEYLSGLAIKKLDTYFNVDTPEHDPCHVCCRKGVDDPEYVDKEDDASYCSFCDSGYDLFRKPTANPHDKEED